MKTQKTEKCVYSAPLIECLELDNEISLALQSTDSTPPELDNERTSKAPVYFNNDPFKTNIG